MLSRLKSFAPYIGLLLGIVLMPAIALGQATLLPNAVQSYTKDDGTPASAGTIDYYVPNTFTRKNTWRDSGKTQLNPNPIPLDAAGRPDSNGAGTFGDGSYRQIVKDADGNVIWDALTASTGGGGSGGGGTIGDGLMVGAILPWTGLTAPPNYIFAYGETISRTFYPEFFAYATYQFNAICASGSPILSGITSTESYPIGAPVEAACIAPGATIVSKTTNTITVSSNATISTNIAGRVFPWGNGDGATTFKVPDFRGVQLTGRPNMGGTDVGKISSSFYGVNPLAVGAYGGAQSKTLATANLPPYTPAGTVSLTLNGTVPLGSSVNAQSGGGVTSLGIGPTAVNFTGSSAAFTGTAQGGTSTAFSLLDPAVTVNYIIKISPDLNGASVFGVASIGGMQGVIACGTGLTCAGNTISALVSTLPAPTPVTLGGVFSSPAIVNQYVSGVDTTGAILKGFLDTLTNYGDVNTNISPLDQTVGTTTTFTAARTWTLPAANGYVQGRALVVTDAAGAINGANTLTIQRAGADTVNGSASVTIPTSRGGYVFYSDGVSNWSAQPYGGTLATGVTTFNGRGGVVASVLGDYNTGLIYQTQYGTGAVQQNLRDVLFRDGVSPQDYGAVCDATTNDYTAIQDAINFASSANVPLRLQGYCKYNTALSVTGPLTIIGNGMTKSALLPAVGINCINVNTDSTMNWSGFQFQYPSLASPGTICVNRFVSGSGSQSVGDRFDNVGVYFARNAVAMDNAVIWNWTNSIFAANENVFYIDNTFHFDNGDMIIANNTFTVNTGTLVTYLGGGGLRFLNNKASNFGRGVQLQLRASSPITTTGVLIATGNSLENDPSVTTGDYAFLFQRDVGAGQFYNVILNGNEVVAQNFVSVPTSGGGTLITNFIAASNNFQTHVGSSGTMYQIDSTENINITGGMMQSNNAGSRVFNMGSGTTGFVGPVSRSGSLVTDIFSSSNLVIDSPMGLAFADLPTVAAGGSKIYVTDGLSGSGPCSGTGSGSMAFRQGGAWKCF